MAESRNHDSTPEHYEETRDPRNPPNSVLQPEVRRTARWSFLFPILILAIIAGLLWMYWGSRPPRDENAQRNEDRGAVVGTAGKDDAQAKPGGFNNDPRFDSTQDELKYRGGDRRPNDRR